MPPEFPAVHDRHHEIEQDDVRRLTAFEILQRFASVRYGRGLESFEREQLRHHLAQIRIVFDDEDGALKGRVLRGCQQRVSIAICSSAICSSTSGTCKLYRPCPSYRSGERPI